MEELRVDIRADGLRANSTTLLLDTSITHIIDKAKDPASQPQARQGKSRPKANPIKAAETIKDGKYKEAALRAHKEFIPLVMDTYGRMGKPFLKLLKDVADHQAHRTSGAVNAHTQGVHTEEPPPLEFRNRAYLHNIALVHVSLISTIMRRVLGHTVTSTRWRGARQATQAAEFYRNPTSVTSDEF